MNRAGRRIIAVLAARPYAHKPGFKLKPGHYSVVC